MEKEGEIVIAVGVLAFFGTLAFLGYLVWMQIQKSPQSGGYVPYVRMSDVERVERRLP